MENEAESKVEREVPQQFLNEKLSIDKDKH